MMKPEMMKIGRTALLKEGERIKVAVVEGHSEEMDMKRVQDFGVAVDVPALVKFLGVKVAKKSTKKKPADESGA